MQSKKKPAKPYPHFPLFAHASGKWAKKISGKIEYFGRWEDPLGALAEFKRLYADGGGGPTTKTYLCLYDGLNEFLVAKEDSKIAGSLSRESFRDYKQTCKSLIRHFGEDADINAFSPSDFAWYKRERSKQLNLVSMGNEIQRVRTAFKWLRRSKLIDDEPEYGPDFRKPTALQIRRHKRHLGSKCYTPRQFHQILDECGVHLRAMAFLGLNCGYGPTDLALQNACQEKNSGRKSKKHMACFSSENEACAAEATTNRREEIKSMHEGDYFESGNERRESKGETN